MPAQVHSIRFFSSRMLILPSLAATQPFWNTSFPISMMSWRYSCSVFGMWKLDCTKPGETAMDLTAPFGRGSVTLAALSRTDVAHRGDGPHAHRPFAADSRLLSGAQFLKQRRMV